MYGICNYKDGYTITFTIAGFWWKMDLPNTLSVSEDIRHETTSVSFYEAIDPWNVSNHSGPVYHQQDSLLHMALETYVIPTLMAFSLAANALIFAVFSMRAYKNNLTAMLYQVLAATDGILVMIRIGLHAITRPRSVAKWSYFCCVGLVSSPDGLLLSSQWREL